MRFLIAALGTLALVATFILLLAPDPKPMSARELELLITRSPARCQNGLRATFAARASTPVLPSRAQTPRDQVCAPELVVVVRGY